MKIIDLTPMADIPANETPRALVATVASFSDGGMTIDDMRKRMRILDALEAQAGNELRLEDSDHAVLCDALRMTKFKVAAPQILAAIDAILGAKTPETV